MIRFLASAALVALVSGSASAESFKVGDLGEMPSRRVCLATASAVLEAYINEFGGRAANGDTDVEDSWSVYGWDLRPGNVDVVITCPVVASQVNAFYTLYSSGRTEIEDADTAAARIRELWERLF